MNNVDLNCILSQNGILIAKSLLQTIIGINYEKLIKSLTITTPQKVGPPAIAKIYKYERYNDVIFIHLPRFINLHKFVSKKVNIVINNLIDITPIIHFDDPVIDLFPNQLTIVDYLCEHVFNEKNKIAGKASCTLDLATGMGKTFVAAGIIKELKVKTLYITPRVYLADQTCQDLQSLFPNSSINIWNKKNINNELLDVTIIVINSALKRPNEFFSQFGLIIFDEIHSYCSSKYSQIFWKTNTTYVLGLSATPNERKDGFYKIHHKHVGNIIEAKKIPGYDDNGVVFNGTVTAIKYKGPPEYTRNEDAISKITGKLMAIALIKQLIADPIRNGIICDEIIKLWRDNTLNIFVFSELREHLDILAEMLKERANDIANDLFAPEIEILRGGATLDERNRAMNSRIILTTYGYSSTGISIIKMNAAVFATPRRSNYNQIVGRIMRRGSDITIHRRIIDIIDELTGLRSQFSDRLSVYKRINFNVVPKKINSLDLQ